MLRLCRLTEYNILPSILLMRISPLLSLHFITFSFCLGEDLTFFESKIRPVLSEKCYECHSARGDKVKGGLRLDHIDLILKGGDTGPALVRGNPEDSLLVEAIRYQESDFQMPPKGKLKESQIGEIETWIKNGAFWPDEPVPELSSTEKRSVFNLEKRRKEHWCWQPISPPTMPVAEVDKNLHPIDQLIREKLAHADLLPSKLAEKRTWLRRVTYDLTGLPPSLSDIESFISDHSVNSYEIVVDRLLASPHYGEKWARHWMDLVRYAETCGHEFDYPLEHPHEYRDYLIRAFNLDVPYDQFLREHVAGDLIENPRLHPDSKFNESVIGTGFWYFHEAVHAPTDPKVDNADRMENQLDVFGKTFLGLTIGCARCHDHKFDAISEKDYYSLAAYIQGSTRQEYPLDEGGKRREVSQELSKLSKEAFSSLKNSKLVKGKPSVYWHTTEEIFKPKNNYDIKGDPWEGDSIANFDQDLEGWKPIGKAFGAAPQTKTSGNNPVTNFHGKGWAGSLISGGDKLTGELHSPQFKVTKRFINFLVAGGSRLKVGIELWINDKKKLVSRGSNNENFTPRSWDLNSYLGCDAQIRLVDYETGGWGHIHADRFVLSSVPSTKVQELPVPYLKDIERIADSNGLSPKLLESWCYHFKQEKSLFATSKNFEKEKGLFTGLSKGEENFLINSSLFADFKSGEVPEGWKVTGEAFKPRGKDLLFLDNSSLLPHPDRFSSRTLGIKRVGNLRSPHFKIEHDNILIKAKSNKVFIRAVIDNFHMAIYNALLFNGTFIKEANSDGEFKWFTLNTRKYKGHWAYLEIVDKGREAFIEIDQVRFANGGIGKTPSSEFPFIFNQPNLKAENLSQLLDKFYDLLPEKLEKGNLSGEEIAFVNYLKTRGLLEFEDADTQQFLAQASEVESKTPRERYVLAMGKGSSYPGNVYVRGSPHSLGDSVKSRNLSALGGQTGDRLQLANNLVTKDNPLVARVMANRIWLKLFGRGIVPTPDDFGPMGQEPSHPKLLDWLASDFRENNWSVKNLIRQIVLTHSYRQSSITHPDNSNEKIELTDPQNILLYKMPVRRLQAEFIRDSILSFSGRLDYKMYGKSIAIHRTPFMTGRGGRGSGPLDGAGRRSIYGSVYRNFISPFMLAFDQPAPFGTKGRRSVSNVPAQSLALLNDPFVIEQCKLIGKNIFELKGDTSSSLQNLYSTITGKELTQETEKKLLLFLENQSTTLGKNDQQLWADLAHVLINSKSFLFLN